METKYKQLLAEKIEKTTSTWFQTPATEADLYRFFHMIKGTAGTLGLHDLSTFAAEQLSKVTEESAFPYTDMMQLTSWKHSLLSFFEDNDEEMPQEGSHQQLILLIESDFEFANHLKQLLESEGFHVMIALTAKRGIELFYTLQPSMVFLDHHIEDMDSMSVLSQIYPAARAAFIPITFLSDRYSPELHQQVLDYGAMDYFRKPLDSLWFISFVQNRLRQKQAIQEFGLVDALTGAGNRKAMNDTLQALTSLYHRTGDGYTLVLLDLDHFKRVNDQYGHLMGDEVLRRFGTFVNANKRDSDLFFRYGGEEFALIIPKGQEEKIVRFIQKLRLKWADEQFHPEGADAFSVTFSAGVASITSTADEVIEWADQALYSAKQQGRNQTKRFVDGLTSRKKLAVILVDDDDVVSGLLEQTFQQWFSKEFDIVWHRYETAEAFYAASWYEKDTFYILLLDWLLPGVDGIDVLRTIRHDYASAPILVSMLTARTSDESLQKAMDLGADDYIQKPFQAKDVRKRVQNLAQRFTGEGVLV